MAGVKDETRKQALDGIRRLLRQGGVFMAQGEGSEVSGLSASVLQILRGIAHQELQNSKGDLSQQISAKMNELLQHVGMPQVVMADITKAPDDVAQQAVSKNDNVKKKRFARVAGSRQVKLREEIDEKNDAFFIVFGPLPSYSSDEYIAELTQHLKKKDKSINISKDYLASYLALYNVGICLGQLKVNHVSY